VNALTKFLPLSNSYGTPLWVYDADVIRRRIFDLRHFDVIRYAQKANSNLHILRLMREEGVVVDAVSEGEIHRSLRAGYEGGDAEGIVFTADVIDGSTLALVLKNKITVNAGSLDMLERIGQRAPGHKVWLRINPGFGHGHSNKTNTGGEHSKHGIWFEEVHRAVALVRKYKLQLIGLHMHIGSGVDYRHLAQVCGALVTTAKSLEHDIHAISAGGGLSIPYSEDEAEMDTLHYFNLWDSARNEIANFLGHPIKLEIEPGRFLMAQAGILLAEVHAVKETPSHRFVIVDAGFNDLARPSFYGSYHKISVLPSDGSDTSTRPIQKVAVAGPLCEAGDVFTQATGGIILGRDLPTPEIGDFLVFHDVGAYGSAMSSNYNSKPLAPEVLVDGGVPKQIRRKQTMDHLLSLEDF
jgi:diaminopimelate decarboxylase